MLPALLLKGEEAKMFYSQPTLVIVVLNAIVENQLRLAA